MRTFHLLWPAVALATSLITACSDDNDVNSSVALETTLKGKASFPIGNVIYLEDDSRFDAYRARYFDVLDVVKTEFDYVGHDEIFRIRETHPTPDSTHYDQLDAFIDFAQDNGYRIHGHNLLFYSDIGADSWIAEYRRDGTWSREQWRAWFEQYIKDKVGRYKGRVASWDVLNEPLARAILDDGEARNIFIELAGSDIYAKAFQWAREADPDAALVLNEFFLGPNSTEKTDALIELAQEIEQGGGKVDVIGFEGIYFFSPLLFSAYSYNYERFKKAADAGYMVTLSELNVALNTFPAAGRSQSQNRLMHSIQRKAFNNIVSAYLDAVPEQQRWGIVTWGLPDYQGFTRFGDIFKDLRVAGGGSEWPLLWNDSLDKKPAYYGFSAALDGVREPFLYASVYEEGDLIDDQPLSQDFKAELLQQLDFERLAASVVPGSGAALERYYNDVKVEIENSADD